MITCISYSTWLFCEKSIDIFYYNISNGYVDRCTYIVIIVYFRISELEATIELLEKDNKKLSAAVSEQETINQVSCFEKAHIGYKPLNRVCLSAV